MNTQGINETITCKKGFYFGDPCYIMKNANYDELLDQIYKDSEHGTTGKVTVNGIEMIVDCTAYGDGCYLGRHMKFGVDAGLLAVVPIELCKRKKTDLGWICTCKDAKVSLTTTETGKFIVRVNDKIEEEVFTCDYPDDDDYEDDDY